MHPRITALIHTYRRMEEFRLRRLNSSTGQEHKETRHTY